jgi:hypothetical protein
VPGASLTAPAGVRSFLRDVRGRKKFLVGSRATSP